MKILLIVVLFSLYCPFSNAQGACQYKIVIGKALTFDLCQRFDTVPVYDANGEILADSVVRIDTADWKNYVQADIVKAISEIFVLKTVDGIGLRLSIQNLNVRVYKNQEYGRTFYLKTGVINNPLLEEYDFQMSLQELKVGDFLVFERLYYLDGERTLSTPLHLVIEVIK